MNHNSYDPHRLRAQVPALTSGAAHFDGPGGTQTPAVVSQAIAEALLGPLSNRGRGTRAQRRADDYVVASRHAMADLLGADPHGIVFGRSTTQLTFDISRTLAQTWGPGDEVIVTRLDHDANVRPWVIAAERAGATVRWAPFDPATGELPVQAVTDLLSDVTRVVAVTGASNLIGTRPDIPAITAAARTAGALSYVDGVHLTAHAPVDVAALGADFFACSPYKFLGPHLGVVAARTELWESLHPDKLLPATNQVPERFELGTLPYEMLAGVTAAVDVLAGLVEGTGSRRERIVTSMTALEHYEDTLSERLRAGLESDGRITVYGKATHRTPTHLFTVADVDAADVSAHLAAHEVDAPAGNFYALECSRHLGLGDAGGVRAGLAPYTTEDDVDRLLHALARL